MDALGLYWFLLIMVIVCYFLFKSEARRKEKESASKAKPSLASRSSVRSQAINSPSFQLVSSSGEVLDISIEERVSSGDPLEDDYQSWLSILSERNPHKSEFELYGTKAAILWGERGCENLVEVVCITSFSKEAPVTKKYDHYSFDIAGWYWNGIQPRGCAAKIKEKIKALGVNEAVS